MLEVTIRFPAGDTSHRMMSETELAEVIRLCRRAGRKIAKLTPENLPILIVARDLFSETPQPSTLNPQLKTNPMAIEKEELQERAQLVRIFEASCQIEHPTPDESNFRLGVMKAIGERFHLRCLRDKQITGPVTATGRKP